MKNVNESEFLNGMVKDFESGFENHVEGLNLNYSEMLDVAHDYALDYTYELYGSNSLDDIGDLILEGRNLGLDAIGNGRESYRTRL